MKKIELIIFGLLLLGGFIAIFLPDTKAFKHVIDADTLLYEVSKEGRYISTDELAQAIMENDPSYIVVDLRSPEEYQKYSINGALNIPYENIFDEENLVYFDQDVYTTVLFSNGSSLADQAWLQLRSYDYQGNKVLKGGMNKWYQTIINPKEPTGNALTDKTYNTYLFRKGASQFFTGIQPVPSAVPDNNKTSKPSVTPVVRRKKKEVSGGCG